MKIISFACFIIFFTSCKKMDLSGFGNSGGGGGSWYSIPDRDSSNTVKADITRGGAISHFSTFANSTGFYKNIMSLFKDSSFINIDGSNQGTILQLKLVNIISAGTYSFGYNAATKKGADMTFSTGGIDFVNDKTILSGSITIDSLTSSRIKGTFSVNCWNGVQQLNITNGSFVGELR